MKKLSQTFTQLELSTLTKKSAKVISSITLFGALTLSTGCSVFSVYKIDVEQGTPITQEQANKVTIGMEPSDVLNLLGSPAIFDTLETNRWDYIYNLRAGTFAKRFGDSSVTENQQHLIIYFDQGKVIRVEGIQSLPIY